MRLKDWKDCTTSQKIARILLFGPVVLAGVGYLFAGMWFLWIIMK